MHEEKSTHDMHPCFQLVLTCQSIPQSKKTLLSEHMASAKKTSMKGTARGMPDCRQKHRGLISSNALWKTVTHAVRIHCVEGRGSATPMITAM